MSRLQFSTLAPRKRTPTLFTRSSQRKWLTAMREVVDELDHTIAGDILWIKEIATDAYFDGAVIQVGTDAHTLAILPRRAGGESAGVLVHRVWSACATKWTFEPRLVLTTMGIHTGP